MQTKYILKPCILFRKHICKIYNKIVNQRMKGENQIKRREEKGMTLVALMITIIILAAVTILTVTNHNIIGKTSKGAEEYAKGQEYEIGEVKNGQYVADLTEWANFMCNDT